MKSYLVVSYESSMTKESSMATTQHNPQRMPTTGGSPALSGKGMIPLVAALILCVLSYQLNASMIPPALTDMAETIGVSVNDVNQVS